MGAATVVALACAASSRALAETKTAIEVTRAASAKDCPDAPALVARTAASGAKTAFVVSSPSDEAIDEQARAAQRARRAIVVAFDRDGEERRASIAAPGGRTRTLVERASDCDGLADAVVLALVLSTDGGDDAEPSPPPAPPRDEAPAREPAAATEGPRGLAVRASAGAMASNGVVRELAPGAMLGLHLGPQAAKLRAGAVLTFVPPNDLPVGSGSIEVLYAATAIDLCWAPLRDRPVAIEACGRGEIGLLAGQARGFATNEDRTRPRVAGGAAARAVVPLAPAIGVFLEGSALAALRRQRFAIEGAGVAYDPPSVGLGAGAGLTWSIR
jgi:hypothetical protein